ncbi:MAG TPA: hypothetical protein VE931_02745 [Pyrinomonadaceae bacterium]|nr:hypothetical protein [Pyrinomonadaceae bacterium]
MRTRTEITVERERWVVVHKHRRIAWCRSCSRRLQMLSTDDAAILAGVNSRTIFHWAESGVVHSTETAEGLLLICPNSLNV